MLMRKLGRTGMNVAALCLGGNTFGWTTDQKASEAVLDAYMDAGGNFIDSAKGTTPEAAYHGAMAKPEVIALLKKTFQSALEMITPLTDAQLLEPVKFPFGDRTVTRATFWQGPLYQIRNHYGQLVVYLRMNGIVPPTTARR